ncbi:MAG: hypothetical protein OEN50_01155 [Deltaproteobacteria bacterium]|nr:hypothetical protein [Deltaproteobacteria bacterium]
MGKFNLGPILLLILFVLIPLVNYFLNRRSRRFEDPAPKRQPMPDMGFRRQAAPSSASVDTWEPARAAPPRAEITQRRTRRSRRGFFITRRDMRRAIIVMTVLGPCRANETQE